MNLAGNKLPNLLASAACKLPFFKGSADAHPFRRGIANLAVKATRQGKAYLVKFAVAPASKPSVFIQANYEKRIAGRISRLGISPEFLAFGSVTISGRRFPYSIQEFVPGRELDYSKDIGSLSRLLHKLHASTNGKESICSYRILHPGAYLLKRAELDLARRNGNSLIACFTRRAFDHLEIEPNPDDFLSLIHNDLTAENILVTRDRPYLIDWGWAMYSSAAFDLCNFISPFTTSWESPKFLTNAQITKFLKSYFRGFSHQTKKRIFAAFTRYWLPYNSLLANWIYYDFLPSHETRRKSHFASGQFLKKAFAHADIALGAFDSQG
ncbi:MAG TPA: phosphotransferase [Candidatus Norongarragalinales archaeon]|nr:phosphotransferase [Candidatus Norongarragalinales archaeon]